MDVLLVEDDEEDREVITRLLGRAGATVHDAGDLATAKAAVERHAYDCVLCDLKLPDGDGLTLVRELGEQAAPRIPVVVMTGDEDEERAVLALQAGAQEYLVKGQVQSDELVRVLNHAIERQRTADLQQELIQRDRLASIGQLAAGVAHEVNNPASVVLNNIEVLRLHVQRLASLVPPERAEEFAPVIAEVEEILDDDSAVVQHIAAVVSQLRSYAHAGPVEVRPYDPKHVIESVAALATGRIRHHARLEVDVTELPELRGDPGSLFQAVLHLLNNAVWAVEEAPRGEHLIRVEARHEGADVVIHVTDTGVGIAPEIIDRVFDPFFTTRRPGTGTGMGLALVAEIVRRHGGSIRVVSVPAEGARFTITLPIRGEPRQVTGPIPHLSNPVPRLLLVDDDARLLRSLARLLGADFEVVTATGGRAALKRLEKDQRYDAILCDLVMPDVDGQAVYEWLRANAPALAERTVFCTAGATSKRARAFCDSVERPILPKPIPYPKLRAELEKTIPSRDY